MTTQTQAEFFQAHAVNDQLTPEQMAEMLNLPEGDISIIGNDEDGSASPDAASAPAAPAPAEPSAKVEPPTPSPAAAPVLLAKDGVHTIPYETLEQTRLQAQQAQEEAARLRAENEALKAKTSTPAPTPEPAAPAVDADLFGDYSEAAMAQGVSKLVAQAVAPLLAEVESLKGQLGQAEKQAEVDAATAHWNALYKAHPDLDSITQSKELQAWIASKPRLEQKVLNLTLQDGETGEIVEMFDRYKQETGITQRPAATTPNKATSAADAAEKAAAAAVAAARTKPPTSLSEIPAGTAAHHDPAAALLEMTPTAAMGVFEGKTPEQINALLNKVL